MELKLEVYSPALELLGVLEVFDSLLVRRLAFGAGSFSLESMLTDQTRPLLRPENILWIEGETAGIIEYVQQQAGQDGPGVTVKGPLLTGLLARRILWGRYDLTGAPAQIMNRLVEDCCISPSRGEPEARKLPGLALAQDSGTQGTAIRVQKTGGSLLEALEELGQTYQVAFGVRFNPQGPGMEFWTRPGLNRSVNQTEREPVFYSTELDDVLASEYCYDSSDYKNICLAAGEGEGENRVFATVIGRAEQPEPGPEPGAKTIQVRVADASDVSSILSAGSLTVAGVEVAAAQVEISTEQDEIAVEFRLNKSVKIPRSMAVNGRDIGHVEAAGDRVSTHLPAQDGMTVAVDFTNYQPPPPAYTIAVSVEAGQQSWGTVSGGGQYQQGQTVTVAAVPAEGYQFVEWREEGQKASVEAEYTFSVERDRSLAAVFAVASRLPVGYTEVEYIESPGVLSGIDTGIKISGNKTKFIIEMEAGNVIRGDSESILSSYASDWPLYIARNSKDTQITYRMGNETKTISVSITGKKIKIILDFTQGILAVGSRSVSITPFSSIKSNNQFLLRGPAYGSFGIKCKLYSSQVYTDDTLEREFVPCQDSKGIAGMYDLIGGKFYESAFDAFTPGPAV